MVGRAYIYISVMMSWNQKKSNQIKSMARSAGRFTFTRFFFYFSLNLLFFFFISSLAHDEQTLTTLKGNNSLLNAYFLFSFGILGFRTKFALRLCSFSLHLEMISAFCNCRCWYWKTSFGCISFLTFGELWYWRC